MHFHITILFIIYFSFLNGYRFSQYRKNIYHTKLNKIRNKSSTTLVRRLRLTNNDNSYDSSSSNKWRNDILPYDYQSVENLMNNMLQEALYKKNNQQRISIDLLTPGLNSRLEQKAMLFQEYLFDVVISMFPTIQLIYSNIRLCFQSMGDAAGFQKYCNINQINIPDNIILTDIDINRITSNAIDCIVFIAAKNNVGSPVINMIQDICETYLKPTYIFLNCDLSPKVTTGLQGNVD